MVSGAGRRFEMRHSCAMFQNLSGELVVTRSFVRTYLYYLILLRNVCWAM